MQRLAKEEQETAAHNAVVAERMKEVSARLQASKMAASVNMAGATSTNPNPDDAVN